MGAAALIAVSFGLLEDIKHIKEAISVSGHYSPNPDHTAVYDKIYPVFKNLYKDNKKSFAALNG